MINKNNFKKTIELDKKDLLLYLFGTIMLISSSFLLMLFPKITGLIIDNMESTSLTKIFELNSLAIKLIIILLIQSILTFGKTTLFSLISEKLIMKLRIRLFNKYITQRADFFDKNEVGEILSRLNNDVSILNKIFSITFPETARQVIILITGLIFIYMLSAKLSIIMILIFPIIIIIGKIFSKKIKNCFRISADNIAASNATAEAAFQSILSVKTFTAEKYELNKFSKKVNSIYNTCIYAAKWQSAYISVNQFFTLTLIVTLIWYGAILVFENEMSIGDLISFILYTTFIGGALSSLGNRYSEIQQALGASENIRKILETNGEDLNNLKNLHQVEKINSIVFQKINFTYKTRNSVILENFSLNLSKGEKIAIIGKSGSGKSTIIKLLLGLYTNYDGEILINGINMKEIDLYHLRSKIGIVPQEVILFNGTVMENISYGKPNAKTEEILDASIKANADEFIQKFPNGYNTIVGQRGTNLSGGQKQRIAIARAILKNPSTIILDEATSSLDVESEKLISEAMENLMKERSTIIIAHRLSTIEKADRILVVDNGKVVETGTHEDLYADRKEYFSFVTNQIINKKVI